MQSISAMSGGIRLSCRNQVMSLLLALFLLCVPHAARSESLADRLLTDYFLLKEIVDPATGLHVELGLNANFSSYDTQLALYEDPVSKRWTHIQTGITVFNALRVPNDVTLTFENGRYTVTYAFKVGDISVFLPEWRPPNSREALCFRVKSPDGERLLESAIAR